jgi:hypothetical protein
MMVNEAKEYYNAYKNVDYCYKLPHKTLMDNYF